MNGGFNNHLHYCSCEDQDICYMFLKYDDVDLLAINRSQEWGEELELEAGTIRSMHMCLCYDMSVYLAYVLY